MVAGNLIPIPGRIVEGDACADAGIGHSALTRLHRIHHPSKAAENQKVTPVSASNSFLGVCFSAEDPCVAK